METQGDEIAVCGGSSSGGGGGSPGAGAGTQKGDDWNITRDELVSAGTAGLSKSCVRFAIEKLAQIETVGDAAWGSDVLETVKSTSVWETAVKESEAV